MRNGRTRKSTFGQIERPKVQAASDRRWDRARHVAAAFYLERAQVCQRETAIKKNLEHRTCESVLKGQIDGLDGRARVGHIVSESFEDTFL